MAADATKILTGPIVLFVDTNLLAQEFTQAAFEQQHIRMITANDGLGALTAITDTKIDVIFLALRLPRMNGLQVCKIIRRNLQFREIPIVLLTEKNKPLDKIRARLAGATNSLTKPLDTAELVETAQRYLRTGPMALPRKS